MQIIPLSIAPALIANPINRLGWRTKQWTAKRSGQVRGCGKWTDGLVSLLLRNPVHIGERDSDTDSGLVALKLSKETSYEMP